MKKTKKNITSTESKTRVITVVDDIIIYTVKVDCTPDYITYNDVLYKLLTLNKLVPFRSNGRLCFNVYQNGTQVKFYMYDLAIACYMGVIKYDSYLKDIQDFLDYKRHNGFTVDHADNNTHNNTVYNISLMNGSLNSSKSDIVAKVKEPLYLNTAYYNNEYRVQMLFKCKGNRIHNTIEKLVQNIDFTNCYVGLHFVCTSPDDYVECLKWLTESVFEWADPIKENGQWVKNDNGCWCLNINNSIHAQQTLCNMPIEQFQAFSCNIQA